MANISNLTNTEWLLNNELHSTETLLFEIDFTSNSIQYDHLKIELTGSNISVAYIHNFTGNIVYSTNNGWLNDNYKHIVITSGVDTSSLTFINWLNDNATLINVAINAPQITLSNNIVSWEAVTNAVSYNVYKKVDGNDELIADTTSTQFDILEFGSGTYFVVSNNDNFDSPASNQVVFTEKNILLHPQSNGTLDETTNLYPKTKLSNVVDFQDNVINEVLEDSDKLVTSAGIYDAIANVPKEIEYMTLPNTYANAKSIIENGRLPVIVDDSKRYYLVFFNASYAVFAYHDLSIVSGSSNNRPKLEIIELRSNGQTTSDTIVSPTIKDQVNSIDSSNKSSNIKYPSNRAITDYVDSVDTNLQNQITSLDTNKLNKVFSSYAIASQLGDSDSIAINSGGQVYYLTMAILKQYIELYATDHYKGDFVSLAALEAAYPTGEPGDYAYVVQEDPDDPTKVILIQYIWDETDQEWQEISGGGNYVTTATFQAFQTALINGTTVVGKSAITNQIPLTDDTDENKMLYVDENGDYILVTLDESLHKYVDNDTNKFGINFSSEDLVEYVSDLFLERFNITGSITNGTLGGAIVILDTKTAQCQLVPNENYGYPTNITVTGATYNYNNQTGVINLSQPTGDVTITATCYMIYTLSVTTNNGEHNVEVSYLNSGDKITERAVIEITPGTNYFLPNSVSVTNASYTYNDLTGIIVLTNPTGNVSVSVTCVLQLAQPSISISGDILTIQDVTNASKYEIYANGVKVGEVNA